MALSNKRIVDLPERATLNSDDYTVVDGSNGGTGKYKFSKIQDDINDLKDVLNKLTGNLIPDATILQDFYIDGSTRYLRIGAGSNRTICVNAKPNTTYVFKKNTATVVRAGCGNTDTPVNNNTYAYNYVTNGTASSDEIEIVTREIEHYIYIQMFIDGDATELKNLSVNLQGATLTEKNTDITEIKNALLIDSDPQYTLDSGEFINATNGVITSQSNFAVFSPIPLKKYQTILVNAAGYSTNVAMIATCNSDNTERQVVVASTNSNVKKYQYTATEDCYVTGSFSLASRYDISLTIDFTTLFDDIDTPIEYPQLFDSIVCIGDSLTVGASGNGSENLTKNYPHFLKKLTVADTTIKGRGGWTAKQVWDGIIANATDLASYDCAIIYLGTNGGLTDTVYTDCNVSDYTQNADTNTGCYGKIIGKIMTDAPNCKIFCVAGPNEYIRRDNTMNDAVRSIAALYDVELLDVANCILSDSGSPGSPERYKYRPVDGIHYNALGYLTFANILYDTMLKCIKNNLTEFT